MFSHIFRRNRHPLGAYTNLVKTYNNSFNKISVSSLKMAITLKYVAAILILCIPLCWGINKLTTVKNTTL